MQNHAQRFISLVTESKKNIKEITPQCLHDKIKNKELFYLIDVREEHEWESGHIPSAKHVSKGVIERDIERLIPDNRAPIVVYCSGGFRSALVADNLQKMGYIHVTSLDTGLRGWVNGDYPIEK